MGRLQFFTSSRIPSLEGGSFATAALRTSPVLKLRAEASNLLGRWLLLVETGVPLIEFSLFYDLRSKYLRAAVLYDESKSL